jgi:hypothetical protein
MFMQNGKVGEGDVFFQENVIIALVAQNFDIVSSRIHWENIVSRMKVQ